MSTKPSVAIVHDSIQYWGGAEKVLMAIHKIFPDAPIFTSTIAWKNVRLHEKYIKQLPIQTTWAQKIPFFPEKPYLYRYLLPIIWRSIDLSPYDIIITSSGSQMSHLVKVRKNQIHICYCHTPPRHLYGLQTDFDWKKHMLIRLVCSVLNIPLRILDKQASKRVNCYIANSKTVSDRIQKIYQRNPVIIYPPVNPPIIKDTKKKNYYLTVGRLSRMKHVDSIIQSFNQLNLPLYVVGIGPERKYLESIAQSNIKFLGQVDDTTLSRLYAEAKALICAAEDEDFGITPVEAIFHNTPVIAYKSGGYKETVIEGKTGIFFEKLDIKDIKKTILNLNAFTFRFNKNYYINFSFKNFKEKILQIIQEKYGIK